MVSGWSSRASERPSPPSPVLPLAATCAPSPCTGTTDCRQGPGLPCYKPLTWNWTARQAPGGQPVWSRDRRLAIPRHRAATLPHHRPPPGNRALRCTNSAVHRSPAAAAGAHRRPGRARGGSHRRRQPGAGGGHGPRRPGGLRAGRGDRPLPRAPAGPGGQGAQRRPSRRAVRRDPGGDRRAAPGAGPVPAPAGLRPRAVRVPGGHRRGLGARLGRLPHRGGQGPPGGGGGRALAHPGPADPAAGRVRRPARRLGGDGPQPAGARPVRPVRRGHRGAPLCRRPGADPGRRPRPGRLASGPPRASSPSRPCESTG